MATIREYFDLDARSLGAAMAYQQELHPATGGPAILAKTHCALEANARFLSFYLPPGADLIRYATAIIQRPETVAGWMGTVDDRFRFGDGSDGLAVDVKELVFTKRVALYVDADVQEADATHLATFGQTTGIRVVVRDRRYAARRSEEEKPLAFISHDSRDKEVLVRALAQELVKQGCPVWYDEYTLKVGDSLRGSIEKGLKECAKCVLVLSPAFLSNDGWGKAEFDSVFTRELLERKSVILPVWHGVSVKDVYEYSPRLADKVGLNASVGVEALAKSLREVVWAARA